MSGYTIAGAEEVPDPVADAPGERRFLTHALDSEQMALTYMVVAPSEQHGPPGMPGFGHSHKTQEEIYFVVSGNLTFKLDDEVFEAGPGTAVRIAPEVVRSVHNDGPGEAELVICSRKADESAADDVEQVEDFWPED
jgi:mannose-6-phosphate isomerase-like protein (cupin superfamily)